MVTTSLAAMAMISAHETVCGQAISSLALASSMRRMIELRHWDYVGGPSFSAWFPGVESSKMDASHPCVSRNIPVRSFTINCFLHLLLAKDYCSCICSHAYMC